MPQHKIEHIILIILLIIAAFGSFFVYLLISDQQKTLIQQQETINTLTRQISTFPNYRGPTSIVDDTNPAPSEVEGWNTYRNEEYRFEIKYPRNWEVDEKDSNDKFVVSFCDYPYCESVPGGPNYFSGFHIIIDTKNKEHDLKKYFIESLGYDKSSDSVINKLINDKSVLFQNIQFSGTIFLEASLNPAAFQGSGPKTFYITTKHNIIYKISTGRIVKVVQKDGSIRINEFHTDTFYQDQFNQILSTFKFLD